MTQLAEKRVQVLVLVGAFLAAAGLHLAWEFSVRRMPSWDQAHHLTLGMDYARAFAEGRFLKQFLFLPEAYPPGYHLLLAAATSLLGPSSSLGLSVNLVALAILMAATYSIGVQLTNGRVGVMAAVLVAMYPGVVIYAREALIEFWLAAVTALSIALLLATREFKNTRMSVMLGMTMGFGMLLKPSFAFAVWLPVAILFVRVLLKREWRALANLAVTAVMAGSLAATWYVPQFDSILALARINREDALRWGHSTSFWPGFTRYIEYVGTSLTTTLGEYLAIAAFIIALVSRWRRLWILHAWIVGAWLVLVCVVVFKDVKYLLPTLPAMALLVADLLDRLKPAWLRVAAILLLGCAHAIALVYAEFGVPQQPLVSLLRTDDQYRGAQGGESWAIADITAAAQHNALRNGARVGVVIDLPRLNGNVLTWQARRTGSPLQFVPLSDSARLGEVKAADLAKLDMMLLKTGTPGQSHLTDLAETLSHRVRGEPDLFALTATFPLADGSQAELYVVQGTTARPATGADIDAIVRGADPAYRQIIFGDRFKMLGMTIQADPRGMLLRIAWEAVETTSLDMVVAVHLLGDAGTILAQADYPMDPRGGAVKPGFRWIDDVPLANEKLAGVTTVALSLYLPGQAGLAIDHGPRDWDNRRLRFPLRR